MPTVRIERVCEVSDYGDHYSTRVYVDDKLVGKGSYGGEPEDNSIFRDYSWVPALLTDLATKLGAKVEQKRITENAENAEDDEDEMDAYTDIMMDD
jgi:hypothetical protein